jgi:hypothetical protein
MTIIDALVVKLGLDSSDLTKGTSAATKNLKDLEGASKSTEGGVKKLGDQSKQSASGVDTLTKSVGALLAIFGGAYALRAFVEDTIASSAALDRLSKNLNVSAGEITAWGNAAEELGGSAKGVQSSMQLLSKAQTDIQLTGASGLIPYFNMLGVSLADANGHALKATDILEQLAGAAEGKDRRTMNNVFARIGFDEGTINLLLRGRSELELTLKRQKEYGEQAAKFAPEAAKLQRSLVDIKQSFTLLGLSLLQQAAPAIEKVLGVLSSLGNWVQNNMEFIKDLGKVLGVIGTGLGVIALATSPISAMVLGIGALAGAIALLWQDYQTWQRGGQTLIDWSKWQPGILAAETAIKNLAKIVKESFGAIYDSVDGVQKLMHGDWKGALASGRKSDNKVRQIIATGVAAAHQEVGVLYDPKSKLRGATAPQAATAGGDASVLFKSQGGVTAEKAAQLAQRVGKATGISPDVLLAQWKHETGNFSNRGARSLNNLSGVNVPGGHGQDYRTFKSLDDYGDYYIGMLERKYKGALGAQDVPTFAKGLKAGGYFTDSLANYEHGMSAFYKPGAAMGGKPGATNALNNGFTNQLAQAGRPMSSSSTTNNNDRGVTIHGDVNIQTRATDGPGVAKAFRDGMNGLLVGQSAGGLS